MSDSYKTWNITEEGYQAVAVISSDESVDHQFPLQLTEPVAQPSTALWDSAASHKKHKINITIALRLEQKL